MKDKVVICNHESFVSAICVCNQNKTHSANISVYIFNQFKNKEIFVA